MNILLLGGNRFVGVEILWHLLHAKHDVAVLALDAPPPELRPHVRWFAADRNDEALLSRILKHEQFDVVIDNIAYESKHVVSLARVLSDRIGRYLLTSTTDCYPRNVARCYTEDQTEIREFDPKKLSPAELYNCGKRSCEAVLMKLGIPWTVLRPCNVIGPRDNRIGPPAPRAIHRFEESGRSHFWAQRIQDGGPLLLTREDETVVKQIWVGDLARAVTHVLEKSETLGQVFNVTGDEIWTNERMIRALSAIAGTTPDIVYAPNALLDQIGFDYSPAYGTSASWTLPDNSKLKATGWQPTPAENWLPFLLEANSSPDLRTWYHTRIQEVALARHVQRNQYQNAPVLSAATKQLNAAKAILRATPASPIGGHQEIRASLGWQQNILKQASANIPLSRFFKKFQGATVSGIGIGTAKGDLSLSTDKQYVDTLVYAAGRGINVFDTAINYRHMRSERCVGEAVQSLEKRGVPREALLIATKGGYITHDAMDARNARDYMQEEYLDRNLISSEEMARKHCIGPEFIRAQIEQSLRNLNLKMVDIYYLHNPEEACAALGQNKFQNVLRETFKVLEEAVAARKIGCYGLATWDGLRVPPSHPKHLSLAMALNAAQDAAGNKRHHLAAIQLPFNIKDCEAMTLATQEINGTVVPALRAAEVLGLYVMTSASALQGAKIPETFKSHLSADSPGLSFTTAALHASSSVPFVGTALVGMRRIQNVEEAMTIASR